MPRGGRIRPAGGGFRRGGPRRDWRFRPAAGSPGPRGPGRLHLLAVLLAPTAAVGGLSAQTAQAVDAGTFELRVDGRTVGTESFEIRRSGRQVRAVGRVSLDSAVAGLHSLEVWLEADANYVPDRFRLRPSGGDLQSVTAVREEERLRLQVSSRAGDRWKEFLASPDLVLLEPGLAHPWLLILRQHRDGLEGRGAVEVPAVVPTEARRTSLSLRRQGPERVEVPGANRTAVRYTATLGGGDEIRIWTAEDGRVLRVESPSRRLTAVRRPGE